MKELWILGIYLTDRIKEAVEVQYVLTKFGCSIKTRLGLHDFSDDNSSRSGLMILELTGDIDECIKLENELLRIEGVDVKKMVFKQE